MTTDADTSATRAEHPVVAHADFSTGPNAPLPLFGWSAALVVAVGGLLTGGLVATVLAAGSHASGDYQLSPIAKGELAVASQSLIPSQAAGLVEQAMTCRAPLASLMVRATGSPKGLVRLRSGAYVSPNLQLGPQPDRIALPYPAPYAMGHGQVVIEGDGNGADVFLSPGVHIAGGQTSTVINVRWDPNAPC